MLMSENALSNCKILICDDSITNVLILSKVLESEGYRNVQTTTDPRRVSPIVEESQGDIDLLILDIEMPYLNGLQVMEGLKTICRNGKPSFPILIISGVQDKAVRYQALRAGAIDFVSKPIDQEEVVIRVHNALLLHLASKAQSRLAEQLERDVRKRTKELDLANESLIEMLALAGEMRDNETGHHVERVGKYCGIIARAMGLPPDICFMIEKAAPLHDIGKIGVPDQILLKPAKLSSDEIEVIRTHAEKGLQILSSHSHDSMLIQVAANIAYNHHERWDGKGYPRGMRGESIPMEGRIAAICDVFDALSSQRPYKTPWPIEDICAYLRAEAGKQFDPKVVDAFFERYDEIIAVMYALRDETALPCPAPQTPEPVISQTGVATTLSGQQSN